MESFPIWLQAQGVGTSHLKLLEPAQDVRTANDFATTLPQPLPAVFGCFSRTVILDLDSAPFGSSIPVR